MTAPPITGSTRIRLHCLRMRPDGERWCVGRMETGGFVLLPPVAIEALRLFRQGMTVDEVAEALRATHGRDINVGGFVGNLVNLGYVAAVDGEPVDGPPEIRPTWPWLRASHVRWTLSRASVATVLALPVWALIALIRRPDLLPTYHDLLWSRHGSLVLAGNAMIGWSLVFLHESAHLVTARAAGVPGRVSFGTRLQFLAVQTDVTGVWAAPRRTRVTVYLSGIAVNLAITATAIGARLVVGPGTTPGQVLGAVALLSALFVPPQLLLFMRTDVYFVIQDIAGCRNLYEDGFAHVRYLAGRAWLAVTRRGPPPPDPSAALASRERRAIRAYAPVLAFGTVLCLLLAAVVTVPTAITLLVRAVNGLFGTALFAAGRTAGGRIDGALTLLVVGGFWALWCRTWWRRHGPRVARWWARRRHQFRSERR